MKAKVKNYQNKQLDKIEKLLRITKTDLRGEDFVNFVEQLIFRIEGGLGS